MEDSCVGLNDLPDEILMIIFQKLNNLTVLYSLHGVNERLNKIVHEPIFTSRLNFVKWSSNNFINLLCSNMMFDRFCLQILPNIHVNIKWLDLESSCMKHILRVADYPNLYGLGLYNINEKTAGSLFTDKTLSSGIFKNQITTLMITIDQKNRKLWTVSTICNLIFTVFKNLIHLTLYEPSCRYCPPLFFRYPLPSSTFSSSTLLKLNIKVQWFHDFLYLLDGRFNQLHTLIVDLIHTRPPEKRIENKGELPNLKCFSLSCDNENENYDGLILPLLHRMSNLEKLGLYIAVYVDKTFIDGNNLKKNIINYMPRLTQFAFAIRSVMFIRNIMNWPSKNDIERTFVDFPGYEIMSCVDYFPEAHKVQCYIYSYPFLMRYYTNITNNFPGGLFKYVRAVSLFDEHPFEHEFFIRIVQSFPFMEQLCLRNHKSQNRKECYKSNDDTQNLSIIQYSYLNELAFVDVHDDYIEQFLFHTKAYLPNNIYLHIDYNSLERVTHNFTRDATRINCAKINEIHLLGKPKFSNSLQDYFPHAKIY